jgi:type IV pilus assembly protein PilY1
MKKTICLLTLVWAVATVWPTAIHAAFDPVNDDTDLFLANPLLSSPRPNVLIFLDNTANWNNRFINEKLALSKVFANLTDEFNVGVMMYTETGAGNNGPDGGYVRAAVRPMTPSNRLAMAALITSFDVIGDKGNNATVSLAMHEIYAYFAGVTARSGIKKKRDYTGNTIAGLTASNNIYALPANALTSSAATDYTSPIIDGCQRNVLIYISNGAPNDNNISLKTAEGLLSGLVGKTPPDTVAISPNGQQGNWADEYARFMANADVNALPGDQNVITYTVEIDPAATGQGPDTTALFRSMAHQGNGKYFAVDGANSTNIQVALNQIFQEVQAVNSVYAAATLPVSANVKGTHLNQVYIGVFRPDANNTPLWFGNLKMYKVGLDTATNSLFLADANGVAAENPTTGFVTPTATSFWSTASTFWSYRPVKQNGAGVDSDAPDGDIVEKGGAAQQLRIDYAASQASRKLYTCTAALGAYCATGDSLSATAFDSSNSDISVTALGVANATEASDLINWIRGQDQFNENVDTQTGDIRASVHGDVLHSRPAVVNFSRNGLLDENDVYAFYGSNDGIFRAVKGGTSTSGGTEVWGFIPRELFGKLKRLRDGVPAISSLNKKPYFMDGSVSVYQYDANNDGKLVASDGDKVYLYVGTRRGGRFMYALDVSDPDDPKLLWRKDNNSPGFAELGQTWSEPLVAKVAASTNPVLIAGAGYDAPVEDVMPCLMTASNSSGVTWTSGATVTYTAAGSCTVTGGSSVTTTRSMGRAVMVIDAFNGNLLWQAGASVSGANNDLTVSGMDYSISSDIAVIDTDFDGLKDTGYVGDNGGNMWRLNLLDIDPANWTVQHIGALGGHTSATRRKLQHRPDVVFANDGSGYFSAVLFGSGDREHPFDATVTNEFYMMKDRGSATTTVASDLFDATTATGSNAFGYKITLASGEKSISSTVTVSGIAFFNTNQPSGMVGVGVCTSNLGVARQYEINYLTAAATNTTVVGTEISARAAIHPGGGYLPSPVPVVLRLNGKNHIGVISGTSIKTPPKPTLDVRTRTFWSIKAR